jgi:hypothetical protein
VRKLALPLACLALVASAAGCGSKGTSSTSTSTAKTTTTTAAPKPLAHPVVVATLSGKNETSNGEAGATGTARVTMDVEASRVCWKLAYTGTGKPLSAHIQIGGPGKEGPVVIPLGSVFVRKGCEYVPLSTMQKVSAHPSRFYVNIHTRQHLNGAVRGQLHT